MEIKEEVHYLEDTIEIRNYNPIQDRKIKTDWHEEMRICSVEYYTKYFNQ